MEAWKFEDLSELSPVEALSLTTERWGLEATGLSEYENSVEGIGYTTVGITKADPVKLAHGIAFLITLLSIIAMGCILSAIDKAQSEAPPRPAGLRSSQLEQKYSRYPASPPQHQQNPRSKRQKARMEMVFTAPNDSDKAKEIDHCADLLRQMYNMDLLIWAQKDTVGAESKERVRKMEKANALYEEIRRIINRWREVAPGYFSPEEQIYVNDICVTMDTYGRQGYHGDELR